MVGETGDLTAGSTAGGFLYLISSQVLWVAGERVGLGSFEELLGSLQMEWDWGGGAVAGKVT